MAGLRCCTPATLSCDPSGEFNGSPWHPGFAVPQLAPPLAQSASVLCLWARRLNRVSSIGRHSLRLFPSKLLSSSGGLQFRGVPNPSLNSDPACAVFRSFSSFRYLGFVQRLGAGGAG